MKQHLSIFHLIKSCSFFNSLAVTTKVGRVLGQKTIQSFLIPTQGGLDLGALKHAVWYAREKIHCGILLHWITGPVYKSMQKHAAEKTTGGRKRSLNGLGRFHKGNAVVRRGGQSASL